MEILIALLGIFVNLVAFAAKTLIVTAAAAWLLSRARPK